jgi:hypothetical protein
LFVIYFGNGLGRKRFVPSSRVEPLANTLQTKRSHDFPSLVKLAAIHHAKIAMNYPLGVQMYERLSNHTEDCANLSGVTCSQIRVAFIAVIL